MLGHRRNFPGELLVFHHRSIEPILQQHPLTELRFVGNHFSATHSYSAIVPVLSPRLQ